MSCDTTVTPELFELACRERDDATAENTRLWNAVTGLLDATDEMLPLLPFGANPAVWKKLEQARRESRRTLGGV